MKTDKQIQQDVIAELSWEPTVNATHIGVEVDEGVVTLAGHVDSFSEKWHAERAALRVFGVKALAIEIDVRLPASSERNDVDIARTVENVLEWTSFLPRDAVKARVEKGWVTLTGEVNWDYQRQAVAAGVRHLLGVTGVSDQIVLKPRVSLSALKADIEAALKRRAVADAHKISVELHGAEVTLTGNVSSWSERDLATQSAWSTPGVTKVMDRMTVLY